MPKGLMIALGKDPEDEEYEDDDYKQDKLDAASELREAVKGDDDQAVVDAFTALYQLCRKG